MIKVNKWISEKEINGASLSYEIYLILYVIFQIMRERERERDDDAESLLLRYS